MKLTSLVGFSLLLLAEGKTDASSCPPWRASIEKSLEERSIPSLAAIVLNATHILYEQAFGYYSPPISDQRQPIDTKRSIFVLASISKTFIALTAMQLVEMNQLDLDEDINQYLSTPMRIVHPLYSNISITMRHILSHRSGIGPNFDEEIKHYVPRGWFYENKSQRYYPFVRDQSSQLALYSSL